MWLAWLAVPVSCTPTMVPDSPPMVETADTSTTVDTVDTSVPALQRPIERTSKDPWGVGAGAELEWIGGDSALLAIGAPGFGESYNPPVVHLVEALVQPDDAGLYGPTALRTPSWLDPYDVEPWTVSGEVALVGDVTSSGSDDLMISTSCGAWPVLFEGPLDGRGGLTVEEDAIRLGLESIPGAAAACGDLNGDGVDELCTTRGIAFGPLSDPFAGFDVTWSGLDPCEHAEVVAPRLGAQPDLVVADGDAGTLYYLDTFPAGDHDLASLASASWAVPARVTTMQGGADLSGDGVNDLVVAWEGPEPTVVVATTIGGDLSAAYATLDVHARALAVADFDGDGNADLAVGTRSAVRIYTGPLAPGPMDPDGPTTRLVGHGAPSDGFGFALAAADMDGDGDSELAVGAPDDNDQEAEWAAGRVYVFHDPVGFSWDAFDPPLTPLP